MEEELYQELDRRFGLKKNEDDYLQNDDTQIGVEFAYSFLQPKLTAMEQQLRDMAEALLGFQNAGCYCQCNEKIKVYGIPVRHHFPAVYQNCKYYNAMQLAKEISKK